MTDHGDSHHGGDHGHAAPAPPPPPASKPGAVLIGCLVVLFGELIILWQSGVFAKIPGIQPEAISSYAADVDGLFYLILGITGFFFLLTEGLLLYFLYRYRAKPGEKARHTHGNHTLELVWTIVPGVILFALAVIQTGVWGDIKFQGNMPAEKDSVVVQVIGKQFEWHFRYAGKDGVFGTNDDVTKLKDLRVPLGKNVIVKLRTMDVLHSFWLPNVRLKQDLLSGQTIRQWFKCIKTGTYEVVCAELCGLNHTSMKGALLVLPQEEFDAWLASRAAELAEDGGHVAASDPIWKHWKD